MQARRYRILALWFWAASLLLSGEAGARRLPADQLVTHLLAVAGREWRDWGQTLVDARDGGSGTLHLGAREDDRAWLPAAGVCNADKQRRRAEGCHHREPFDAQLRVRRYWAQGLGPDSRPARDPAELDRVTRNEPWSAAFVSFVMEQVGLSREAFPFDDTHSNYLRGLARRYAVGDRASRPEAGDAGDAADAAQFAVLLVADTPLAQGDLICGPRNISRDPERLTLQRMRTLDDLQKLTASHCDLVFAVNRKQREARLIGGNVADSVAMTRIPLTADGRAIRTLSRPWFVLARPR